jgi:ligand-binding sensor domain-containing protein
MKEPKWGSNSLVVAGILSILMCLTACEKTKYDLLDSATAGVWTLYNTANSEVPGNRVWALEMDNQNKLWVSFLGNGVGVYEDDRWTFYKYSNSGILSDLVNDLELNSNGDMIMGTGDGLCMRTVSGEWLYYQDPGVTKMDVKAVKYTSGGDIWAGTNGEGFYVDFGSGFLHYKYTDFENVNAIEEDSEGNIWLGTDKGLLMYDGSSLNLVFTEDNGLPNNVVSALFLDSQKRLWIGTFGGQTVAWISPSGKIHPLSLRNGAIGTYVMDICEDNRGDLWFAAWDGGLIRYDGVVPHSFREYNGFYENYVNCVKKDNYGNIWSGLWSKGLVRYTLPLD